MAPADGVTACAFGEPSFCFAKPPAVCPVLFITLPLHFQNLRDLLITQPGRKQKCVVVFGPVSAYPRSAATSLLEKGEEEFAGAGVHVAVQRTR